MKVSHKAFLMLFFINVFHIMSTPANSDLPTTAVSYVKVNKYKATYL